MSDPPLGGNPSADAPDHEAEQEADTGGLARIRKSPNAFRTISEVADDLHIPQHVLRFWETKFPQVKPMKRGGGRRYYRPGDIGLLRQIANLLYTQGYTIKGVQRLLREGGGRLAENIPPATEEERTAAAAEHADQTASAPLFPDLELASEASAPPPRHAPPRRKADLEAERLRDLLTEVLGELEAIRHLLG